MKIREKAFAMIAVFILLTLLNACAAGNRQTETSAPSSDPQAHNETTAPISISGEVIISLDYERQSGSASNQFAIWIEDMDGNYINTVYA